jgi:hypothetical protein
MLDGQLILNGIDDSQLEIIIRVKIAHEGALQFHPQQMQESGGQPFFPPGAPRPPFPPGMQPPFGVPQPPPQPNAGSTYNNVMLFWHGDEGLAAIVELLHRLNPAAPAPPFPPLPPRP